MGTWSAWPTTTRGMARATKMRMMMKMMKSFGGEDESHHSSRRHGCNSYEQQPAELDNMYNMPGMQHMGTVKSFMTCCKTAKMRLCMNQDTKKKIETNFGPVEELLQSFNNQI